jgi:hypothetical protein
MTAIARVLRWPEIPDSDRDLMGFASKRSRFPSTTRRKGAGGGIRVGKLRGSAPGHRATGPPGHRAARTRNP